MVLGCDENKMTTEEIVTLVKDWSTWRRLVITCSGGSGGWEWGGSEAGSRGGGGRGRGGGGGG